MAQPMPVDAPVMRRVAPFLALAQLLSGPAVPDLGDASAHVRHFARLGQRVVQRRDRRRVAGRRAALADGVTHVVFNATTATGVAERLLRHNKGITKRLRQGAGRVQRELTCARCLNDYLLATLAELRTRFRGHANGAHQAQRRRAAALQEERLRGLRAPRDGRRGGAARGGRARSRSARGSIRPRPSRRAPFSPFRVRALW